MATSDELIKTIRTAATTMSERLKVFDKEFSKAFAELEKTGHRLKLLGTALQECGRKTTDSKWQR